jgi:hypothetical protein
VQRKKKKGADAVYEISTSCSLWQVSQQQGVRLGQLAVWNNLPASAVLQKGARIYMQYTAPASASAGGK